MAQVEEKPKGGKQAKAKKAAKSKHSPNVISFPGRGHTFLLGLILVASAVAVSILFLLREPQLPLLAKPPLAIVMICAVGLVITALKQTRATTLLIAPAGLEVSGPNGKAQYAWNKIETVRVVGAVGTFADDPFSPAQKRIGLALFLRGGNEGRVEAHEADAVLAVGDQDQGEKFVDAAAQITKTLRSRQRGGKAKPTALQAKPPRRRDQFALRSAG